MEREELHYITEDKILAEVLGRQNFSNKESAILELVKNAYDAGAKKVVVAFQKSTRGVFLTISDDGKGMNYDDIKKSWMHVGKSTRGYKDEETNRIYAGSKGIGRFALSRLGEEVELNSKKLHNPGITWSTNWNKSFIDNNIDLYNKGTTIIIRGLRDRWSQRSVKPLVRYLSMIYNDNKMDIIIKYGDFEKKVESTWKNPKIGENFVSSIDLVYDSNKNDIECEIVSDEFKDSAQKMISANSISYKRNKINMSNALYKKILELIEDDQNNGEQFDFDDGKINYEHEIKKLLTDMGNFRAKIYFSLVKSNNKDYERFEYKHRVLTNRYTQGIILYRNAFGIDSFEGRTDWLEINNRAVSSPAAATHKTGSWRVRPQNVSGYVVIDKQENKQIEDLSNRQGLVQNVFFRIMKLIILEGVREFENFRQGIIRDIDAYKENIENENKPQDIQNSQDANRIFNKIRNNPNKIKDLTDEDIYKVIKEYDRQKQENTSIENEKKEIEEKFRYESQLLNVLATSQLKISSVGHEVKNNRNIIYDTPNDLEEELKHRLNWDELIEENVPKYRNIPKLLVDLKDNTDKILKLADSVLEETVKEKFKIKKYTLIEIIMEITEKWEKQYSWITFYIDVDETEEIYISIDHLMVIFDNLILNSIQQNNAKSSLGISIEMVKHGNQLIFVYKDDGKGLDKAYIDDPMKILEVHETTRSDGHGLGMWILNNTLYKLGGGVESIIGNDGFLLSGYFNIQ